MLVMFEVFNEKFKESEGRFWIMSAGRCDAISAGRSDGIASRISDFIVIVASVVLSFANATTGMSAERMEVFEHVPFTTLQTRNAAVSLLSMPGGMRNDTLELLDAVPETLIMIDFPSRPAIAESGTAHCTCTEPL